MTAALEGGEWSAARSGRSLLLGKTRYPLYRRLGGLQGQSGRAENLVPTRIRSRIVQPIVSHYTLGKDPVTILQETGWAPGLIWTGRKISSHTGIRSRTVQPVAQSLYRLSYPAHICICCAFFSLDTKLYRMGGTYFTITNWVTLSKGAICRQLVMAVVRHADPFGGKY